jgi:alpha-tubulin suppressor-like RCC1 family protein
MGRSASNIFAVVAVTAVSLRCGDDGGNVGPDPPGSPTPLRFAEISAGFVHTCALTEAGAAYCWGHNFYGQLGNGTTTDPTVPTSIPTAVSGGLSFSALATSQGDYHTSALTGSGAAFCWGDGPLGTSTGPVVPIAAVSGGLSLSAIAAGDVHSCGIAGAGVVYCWGDNYIGQLGNGTTTNSRVPVRITDQ